MMEASYRQILKIKSQKNWTTTIKPNKTNLNSSKRHQNNHNKIFTLSSWKTIFKATLMPFPKNQVFWKFKSNPSQNSLQENLNCAFLWKDTISDEKKVVDIKIASFLSFDISKTLNFLTFLIKINNVNLFDCWLIDLLKKGFKRHHKYVWHVDIFHNS